MVFVDIELSESYWETIDVTPTDIEFIYSFLLERETPLPSSDLAEALISERIRSEKRSLQKKQQSNGEIYLPKLEFSEGDKIQFPGMNWLSGLVVDVRKGNNPKFPALKVLTVELENGQTRQFASNLETHPLNEVTEPEESNGEDYEQVILSNFGIDITRKLDEKLDENKDLVRIGANWFAKSLLIDFNVGHLNLAEAVLDMHEGGPLPVDSLLEQIDIDSDDPVELVRFSLNYALQEDPRFDEVGPSGIVQWFLNRLEPEYVREKPLELIYAPTEYDRSALSEDMLQAEQQIDDEITEPNTNFARKNNPKEINVVLTYPHWKIGSIPLTHYTQSFFPTAIESPRVKFLLVDAKRQKISAWVVRPYSYIYGLKDWYDELELMPGSIIKIKPSQEPGEVFIQAEKKRSNREWIRTLLIGADGGIVFANLKQTITADFNERMAIAVPSTDVLEELWQKRANNPRHLVDEISTIMQELSKLNPQGQVHAIELYAALNCIRRCPPGFIFSTLATNPRFTSVGDLYFRLSDNS